MRVAEFTLPKVGSDAEDAAVIVYFFGSSQGGTVQANLDRWMTQVTQPDGRASKDVAKTTSFSSVRTPTPVAVISKTAPSLAVPSATTSISVDMCCSPWMKLSMLSSEVCHFRIWPTICTWL